ncbi:hypothetical protein BDY19DRAFT_883360 [Irpex rosettiformis]|uniref:Uncharacterized protein n=1 Tax=Irpex rosettiformis TaxID=378272 RepID=A0ACB8UDW9_9APHY|nr:hypothetical protein BDY19DRAFT_883360 [Irpex rosettiformis]
MAVLVSSLEEGGSLDESLSLLVIPAEFANYDDLTETAVIVKLEEWRRKAYSVLRDLKTCLQEREEHSLEKQTDIICAVTPLCKDHIWTMESSRELAKDILRAYDAEPFGLVEFILSRKIKPLFQRNPHPDVNISTGRKMARSAGGPAGYQDHFESQIWKENLGTVDILLWCIRHTEGPMYERLWHLIIPPVITLIDDYEVRYKLQGVEVVSEMLKQVPVEILRRTGIDGLLFTNLTKCISFLDRPESAALLRAVVPTCISLVELTTQARSIQRFDQLCALLGDGIIGTVWVHGLREEVVVQASVDVLPSLIKALGIGCARYLKALIPQLVRHLIPGPSNISVTTPSVQLSSVLALRVVIEECSPRMHLWKGTILDGLCRRWVTLVESRSQTDGKHISHTFLLLVFPHTTIATVLIARDNVVILLDPSLTPLPSEMLKLEKALQDTCASLVQACPSLREVS